MVVNLLLAALQGAPIARRMQVPESDSDCIKAAQDAAAQNEQLVPDCDCLLYTSPSPRDS